MDESKTTTSERELGDVFRDSDEHAARQAMEKLLSAHGRAIFKYVRYSVRPVEDADDVYQDACLGAFESRRRFNPELASFKTWFFRIAHNKIEDRRRYWDGREPYQGDGVAKMPRSLRQQSLDELLDSERIPGKVLERTRSKDSTEAAYWAREVLRRIHEWLLAEDPETARVMTLRHFDGYTIEEVASLTGLSFDQVRYRDKIKQLREFMRKEGF